jgi:hypothetical protein
VDRTRAEHVAWCKERALEYVEAGDVQGAFASMASDMQKHPATADSDVQTLGMMLMMSGHLSTQAEMRMWIKGFS